MISWSSRKKIEGIFCTVHFVRRKFFNICALTQYIMYWILFQNIHTFTYQKTLLHTILLLVFKIVESLQLSLKIWINYQLQLNQVCLLTLCEHLINPMSLNICWSLLISAWFLIALWLKRIFFDCSCRVND